MPRVPGAAVTVEERWYVDGFKRGVAGATAKARIGQPRLKAMRVPWRAGLSDGAFALVAFAGAFRARHNPRVRP